MGKSTISMAIFNSYVSLPEGIGYANYALLLNKDQAAEWSNPTRDIFPWFVIAWEALLAMKEFPQSHPIIVGWLVQLNS